MKINFFDKKQNSVRIRSMLIGLGGLLILGIIFSIIQLTTAAPDWPTVGHPWVDMQCDANMCVNTGTSLVGVGINSPASKLHVKDGHTWGSDLSIDATGTTGGRRWLLISTGGNAGEGQGKLLIKDNTGGTRIAIDTAGQVGIGTTGPGAKLDVSGGNIRTSGELISTNANQARFISGNYGVIHRNDGSNYYILLTASGDQYGSWNTLRPFRIENVGGHVHLGNSALFIQHGGNVGIGTTSPSQKLHVTGNMRLTGHLYDSGDSAGSTGQVLTKTSTGQTWQTSTSLPAGSSGQTLRHDGTSWVASSVLYNNGTNVGIGTATVGAKLTLADHTTNTGGIRFRTAATIVDLWSSGSAILKTGANFEAGSYRVGTTEVISSTRVLSNVTASASIITSGVFGTARLGSGTADSSKYLRGDSTWASISGPSYVGRTPSSYQGGAIGYYNGGNVKCNAAFPGSRMCGIGDFDGSELGYQYGWYSTYTWSRFGDKISYHEANDCYGWLCSDPSCYGTVWKSTSENPYGSPGWGKCSDSHRILCCK